MRLFVTGGTGFIGSHFIRIALGQGHEVIALRRPESKPPIELNPQPVWHESCLKHIPDALLASCDALLHFAASGVSPQPTNWQDAFEFNVLQSLGLCEQATKLGLPHIIACGSGFEYGRSATRYHSIPVSAPLDPIGPYAASKAAFSVGLGALARASATSVTLLRPFHLYGEGQNPGNLWPALRQAALSHTDFPMTPGEQVRDYMPVALAAEQFMHAVHSPPPAGCMRIANIGSGSPITLKEFATYWWAHWQASSQLLIGTLPYRDSEIMRMIPELSIIRCNHQQQDPVFLQAFPQACPDLSLDWTCPGDTNWSASTHGGHLGSA